MYYTYYTYKTKLSILKRYAALSLEELFDWKQEGKKIHKNEYYEMNIIAYKK